jgi:hypothetical protein
MTDSQSVCPGVEPTLGLVTRYYFLSEGCCLVSAITLSELTMLILSNENITFLTGCTIFKTTLPYHTDQSVLICTERR